MAWSPVRKFARTVLNGLVTGSQIFTSRSEILTSRSNGLVIRSEYLITRSNDQWNPFVTRSVAVRFTRLTESR